MIKLLTSQLSLSGRQFLRLISYARPYQGRLIIGFFSLVLAGLLGLASPQLIRLMMDAAFQARNPAMLNRYILLLFGVYGLQALFSFLRSYLFAQVGERVVADLRQQLYRHLLSLPIQFFAEQRVGELTSRMSSDVTVIQTVASTSLVEISRQSLLFIGGTVIIFLMSPRLTLVMLAIVPVLIVSGLFFGRYLRRLSARVQDALAEANAVLDETLSGIRVVQSFVREGHEIGRYRNSIEKALGIAIRRSVATGGFIAFIIFFIYSGIAVVLWYGGRLVIENQMTTGEMMAFILYTMVIAFSIGGMAEVYSQFQQARGATKRVFELLDMVPEIKDRPDAQALKNIRGEVVFSNVSFRYQGREQYAALDSVSLTARPGEVVALVGPSGAGKTTLVNLIPRFYDVNEGEILIDGSDIRSVKLQDLRNAIGIVPQETLLFSGTIEENIVYGRLSATETEIEEAARAAHAHEFIMDLPDKYRTVVGERGIKLSGGQRQRIAIARALLKDPAILILDEATSSLDSESERLVQNALDRLMQGRTTFVIAHRLSTVIRADRIVVIDAGRIVAQGRHAELIGQEGLYKQLYDLQFRGHERQLESSDNNIGVTVADN